MKTNFFTTLLPILQKGIKVDLTIAQDGDNLVVAFRPGSSNLNDSSLNSLKPLILRHPADKLDEGFFETIQSPMEIMANEVSKISDFEAQIKSAADKSNAKKQANDLKSKEQKEQEKNDDKAKEIIKSAEMQFGANKYDEALKKYEKALSLSPNNETILKAIEKCKAEMIVPILDKSESLFKISKYKECITELRKAMALDPLHQKVQELTDKIIEAIGQPIFDQLTKEKES